KIKQLDQNGQKAALQSILYDYVPENGAALQQALEALFKETEQKIDSGATIVILSDREVIQAQEGKVAIPILLAVSG
ncbi:glutamate synthase central domain-containing protein, partial [Bacteroides uniformis]